MWSNLCFVWRHLWNPSLLDDHVFLKRPGPDDGPLSPSRAPKFQALQPDTSRSWSEIVASCCSPRRSVSWRALAPSDTEPLHWFVITPDWSRATVAQGSNSPAAVRVSQSCQDWVTDLPWQSDAGREQRSVLPCCLRTMKSFKRLFLKESLSTLTENSLSWSSMKQNCT